MEKIFEILASSPVVSIICTTVVVLALIYVLRNQIVEYIKKKYDLYDEQQVLNLMREAVKVFESTNLMNPHKVIEDEKRAENK